MRKYADKWYIAGTVFTIVFGTLLHFVYEWSGKNSIVGIFGAVNESTWEHLKLLFWPLLIFSILEYLFIGKKYNNYVFAKAVSFYAGILLIISLFYTYTGIIGKHFVALDISIFVVSVIVCQYIGYKITISSLKVSKTIYIISLIAIMLLVTAFVFFTFNPPKIPLFKDPTTGGYGELNTSMVLWKY